MKKRLPFCILIACTNGCMSLINPVPANVVTGLILYNGAPAAGKRVGLVGTDKYTFTNGQGRYSFSAAPANTLLHIEYKRTFDAPSAKPHEVLLWQSVLFSLDSGHGKEVPAIDVAYNGVLYPHPSLSLIVKPTSPVPFHWSSHPQALSYRLIIKTEKGERVWLSEWTSDPTAVFAQSVSPGWYNWSVEVDAGNNGKGILDSEPVNF